MNASQFYDWLYWLFTSNCHDEKERRKVDQAIDDAERQGFIDWSALDAALDVERPPSAPSWYTSDEQAGDEGLALIAELGLSTGA